MSELSANKDANTLAESVFSVRQMESLLAFNEGAGALNPTFQFEFEIKFYFFLLLQNESCCTTFHMEMSLIFKTKDVRVKFIIHMKGCSPRLVLKQRKTGAWKYPILVIMLNLIQVLVQRNICKI